MIEHFDSMKALSVNRQVRKNSMMLRTAVMEMGLNLMVYKMKRHMLKDHRKTFWSNEEFISWS